MVCIAAEAYSVRTTGELKRQGAIHFSPGPSQFVETLYALAGFNWPWSAVTLVKRPVLSLEAVPNRDLMQPVLSKFLTVPISWSPFSNQYFIEINGLRPSGKAGTVGALLIPWLSNQYVSRSMKMKTAAFTKRAIQGLVGTLFAVASFGALSAPVTKWGFEVNSGFSAYLDSNNSTAGITASNGNPNLGFMPSLLSWGLPATPDGQSSLGVGAATNGVLDGTLFTDAAAVDTVQVIHNNFPVFAPTLKSATLFDVITLQALEPDLEPSFNAAALTFNIKFLETTNAEGTCVVTTSPTPCNDIFVIDVVGAGFDPVTNSLVQKFNYLTNWYEAVLSIDGLGTLTDAECAAAGAAAKCIGFTTVENQKNIMQVSLAINNSVPEPGSLALAGLALAGLGMIRRRKNAA